jgi:hypothetical protein
MAAARDGDDSPVEVLGDNEKIADTKPLDLKTAHNLHGQDVELENGHLAELEVDLGLVLADDAEEGDWEADTSPFPEVRAVVPETDDTAMPVNTLRAWLLGIVSEVDSCVPGDTNIRARSSSSLALV